MPVKFAAFILILSTSVGCSAIGASSEFDTPPPATLTIDGQTQTSGVGTYCWFSGEGAGICADMIGIPSPDQPLITRSPIQAEISTPIPEAPSAFSMTIFPVELGQEIMVSEEEGLRWWNFGEGESLTLTPESMTGFDVSLEPGLYVVSMFVGWPDRGDVNYGFLIEVAQ